ncbi:DUF1906 domain-containing protein, partial [Catenulispora sp. GAS73]|uniref:DUF1906 domain-containing protein n=1 Tax=Catenulispora sp. GAS73 TaxID=3156269 RepID=UPI0035128C01
MAAQNSAAGSNTSGSAVVSFDGYEIAVPSAWPVVNLEAAPTSCVRFDQHGVYLGHPGRDQICPAHVLGQSEAVVVEPLGNAVIPSGTVWLAPGQARPATIPATTDHRVSFAIPAAGVLVTGSYGVNEDTIARVLASAVVTAQAKPAAAKPPGNVVAVSPHVSEPGSFQGLGFDACAAPSSAAMQAWSSSPYRGVGVYIGGVNRACAQPNLTASWVSGQDSAGWHLFPIYVGLQAPCSGIGATIDPANANAQGQSAAQDAVAQAQGLGVTAGSVLYDDMESYARGGSCTQAVLDFLAGWTTALHVSGYSSGVYSSSGSGISDLVAAAGGSYPSPDNVYFARWNNVPDTNDVAIPAADWSNHQRIHQYAGGHNESYGGVTINIDGDALDVSSSLLVSRLGVLESSGGVVQIKEGGLSAQWSPAEMGGIAKFQINGDWIGVLTTGGELFV